MKGRGAPPAAAAIAAEAAARRSYGKLIAYLSARTRDVAGAEDALSEAFASALVGWAASGAGSVTSAPATKRFAMSRVRRGIA